MATPSFMNLFQRAQQRSVIHQLEAAVLLARHIAVVNRAAVVVCPYGGIGSLSELTSSTNDQPVCAADYRFGVGLWRERRDAWMLMRVWHWPETDVMNRQASRQVHESVLYDATGLAGRNVSWSVCAGTANLSLVLNRIGRPHIRNAWGRC